MSIISNIYDSHSSGNVIVAGIEAAKTELRKEFDDDIMNLASAVFGNTDTNGRLLKPGLAHNLMSFNIALSFLMAKLGYTPEDVNKWNDEQIEKARQTQVTEG